MKRCFASLFAVALVAVPLLVGCGDSATVSRPDTAPPLAPVILGARGADGTVGLWWRNNTEPDLAGYHVYKTDSGLTRRMTTFPIRETYMSWVEAGQETVELYVTAVDWTGNESSPSVTKEVNPARDARDREFEGGLPAKEFGEPH